MDGVLQIWQSTGIANFEIGNVVMIGIGLLLIYLAIAKNFEPLLLLPIGLAEFWLIFRLQVSVDQMVC